MCICANMYESQKSKYHHVLVMHMMVFVCHSFLLSLKYFLVCLQGLYHEQMEKERDDHGIDVTDFGETRTPFTIAITARAQAVDLVL